MIQPATLNITAQRHAPLVYVILVQGIDLSGATLDMHVRLLPDAPSTPLVDLSPAAAGSQGLSFITEVLIGSTITIQIDETTIEGLPAPPLTGDDVVLWYDLQVTRSGQPKAVFFRGTLTIKAGVTT